MILKYKLASYAPGSPIDQRAIKLESSVLTPLISWKIAVIPSQRQPGEQ